MFNANSGYSLADIAAATGCNGNSRNSDMWGDNGAWWIIILFLFCFAGWGGNGNWGGGGSNGAGYQGGLTREELTYGFDMSGLHSEINGLNSSLINGIYGLNTNLLNGFATTNSAIASGVQAVQSDICGMGLTNLQNTNTITNAINADTIASMQNTNAIQAQLTNMAATNAQCCCENKQLIQSSFADLNYNLATLACQNRQATSDGVRDIIENNNVNTRSILDFLVQDKLDTLHAENAALRGQISQSEQNAYLISQLGNKAPIPAYVVANPYTPAYNFNTCCCAG